jgi:hypothetical protein
MAGTDVLDPLLWLVASAIWPGALSGALASGTDETHTAEMWLERKWWQRNGTADEQALIAD